MIKQIVRFCKQKKYFQAEALLNQELNKNQSVPPDAFYHLIKVYDSVNNYQKAEEIFEKFKNLNPNYVSLDFYQKMLGIYVKQFKKNSTGEEKILNLMEELKEKEIEPDAVIYTSYINYLLSKDEVEKAENVVSEISEKIKMIIGIYNCFFGYYAKKGETEIILKMMNEVKKSGIKLDIISFYSLLLSYEVNNDIESCKELCETLITKNFPIDLKFFHKYLKLLLDDKGGNAVHLYDTLKNMKIKPTPETYDLLLGLAIKSKKIQRLNYILSFMEMDKCYPSSYNTPGITRILCKKDEHERAWNLLKTYPNVENEAFEILIEKFNDNGDLDMVNEIRDYATNS